MRPKEHCWGCRKRRLVCDSTYPECTRCIKRGDSCPGYGVKPLKWIKEDSIKSKPKHDRVPAPITQAGGMIKYCRPSKNDALEGSCAVRQKVWQMPHTLLDIPFNTKIIIGAMEYYNAKMTSDVYFDPSTNYHRIQPASVQSMPQSLIHTIISVVFSHRAIQQMRKTLDGCTSDLQLVAYHHKGLAIHYLKQDIASLNPTTCYLTLAVILAFLMAELQHSCYRDWRPHVESAKKLVHFLGGFKAIVGLDASLDSLLAYLMLVDIMSNTTSEAAFQTQSKGIMDPAEIPQALYRVIYYTCFPCPSELLHVIIQINHLRAFRRTNTANMSNLIDMPSSIVRILMAFSPSEWARHHVTLMFPSNTCEQQSSLFEWIDIAQIYHAAVTLYCFRSLSILKGNLPTDSDLSMEVLTSFRASCRQSLSVHLFQIFSPKASPQQTQIRKFTLWPLVIAGVDIEMGDSDMMNFVSRELDSLGTMLGTSSPIEAKDLLEVYWQRREKSGTDRIDLDWEEIFDRDYVFVL